nr:tandem-95 repeat protein [uncultured Sphingomonas sp.]
MRYEDTTQAGGIAQGNGPNAENDLDALTAGSRTPAMGNVITGDGTKSGAAGADTDVGGHITSISGKGGTDSDFAGGKLAVDGDYGRLTIDANGNYRYVPNGTAPENSLDRFVYTLADSSGASDAAVLTIEFGKTQSIIKANAQQVVPGPDGVVVLPAGVQLSDIHVVGRNLVIDLPDGTQMVIVDGAVFVPQLSLDGVDVPSTNLAALLIGSEPKPAAGGEPPSSGGNFEVPVPPLDPGVPLGDLIPPTEYTYTPPEVREPLQDVDHEPSVTIDPGNGVAVEAAVDSVNEAGLPARGLEPEGSNSAATSESTTGTIIIDSQDNPTTVTINGVDVTSVGQVIHGAYGDLTITSISDGAIGYSYTLIDNTSGDNTHDDFTVVVTDVDGDTDTATVRIDIIDDVPTARPDTDSVAAGEFGPVTGNVITDASPGDAGDSDNGADTVGADNATLTSVSGAGGSDSSFDEAGNLVVHGQYGVLTIDAAGNYSYVRDANSPGGVNDVFNYTLTDGDGDTSSSTLTISIADLPPNIIVEDKTPEDSGSDNLVHEAGLPARGSESAGTDAPSNSESTTGTFTASGGDGTLSIFINGSATAIAAGDSITTAKGVLHIDSIVNGVVTYTYTLTDNTSGDNTSDVFSIIVRDADGDTDSATLTIRIIDDVPAAADDFGTQGAEDAPITVDVFANDTPGADSVDIDNNPAVKVELVDGSLSGTGSVTYNNDGTFTYHPGPGEEGTVTFDYTITDGDGDVAQATVTIELKPDSIPNIFIAEGSDTSVNEAGLPGRGGEPEGSGEEAAAGANGDPSEAAAGTLIITTGEDSVGKLEVTDKDGNLVNVTNGGTVQGHFGTLVITGNPTDGYTYVYTLNDNTSGDTTHDDFPILVTDSDGDTANTTLSIDIVDDVPTARDDSATQGTEGAAVTVDVFHNDTPGADGVDIDNNPAVKVEYVDGTLSGSGTLVYNDDGTFTYTPASGEEGTVTFDYTITDGDGDPSTATVTITLQRDSTPQVSGPDNLVVDEDGLPGANVDANPLQGNPGETDSTENATQSGDFVVDYGNDLPANPLAAAALVDSPALDGQLVTLNGTPVTFALNGSGQLVGSAGGVNVMIISITGATTVGNVVTYTYSAQLLQPVQHADVGNNENTDILSGVQVQVTDSDGDTATASFNVTVVDDVPSAAPVVVNQVGEDTNVSFNLHDYVTPGADGVNYANVTHTAATGPGVLSYDPATGIFTYDPAPGQTGDVSFSYTVTDGDGDEVTANVTLHLNADSTPQASGADNLVVDEDGFAFANADNSPLQGNPGETDSTENATQSGDFVVDYGNDLPANPLAAAALVDSPALDGQLVTLNGTPVTFALNGSGQLVGSAGGVNVMIISITGATTVGNVVTYTYSAQLLQPVQHADVGNNENTDILSGVQVQVTDSDGDTATASFNVTVVDDVPSAAPVVVNQVGEDTNVSFNLHDYVTPGADGVNYANVTHTAATGPGVLSYDPATGIFTYDPAPGQTGDVSFSYTVTDGDGDEVTANVTLHLNADSTPQVGTPANLTLDEDGFAFANVDNSPLQSNPQEVDANEALTNSGTVTVSFGNDAPGGTLTNSITLIDTAALDGQLQLLNGSAVTFALVGGVLVGSADGMEVIRISVTGAVSGPGAGQVTYTYQAQLLQPLEHAAGGGENTDLLSGVTFQVTDSDGDTATGSFNVTVYDDVPSATASLTAPLDTIVLDETRPVGTESDGNSAPAGLATASAGFADNFVTAVPGADGATTAYSLVLNGANVASGLYALQAGDVLTSDGDLYGQGAQIVLNYNAVTGVITGSVGGVDYFTISINATSGLVTFTQLSNIWHGNTGSDDDAQILTAALNSIQVKQTVTDGDGDVASATVDISRNVFQIEDDGPVAYNPDDVHATNGNTAPVIANLNLDMGTDGLGQLLFSNEYEGDAATDQDGHLLSLNGQQLYYHVAGNVLTATTAVGGGGTLGFTVTLNSNGTYTFDVNGTISNGTETSFTNLTSSAAGNVDYRLVGVGDSVTTDVLLSARGVGGGQGTVNTDNDSIGVDSQAVNPGAAVRIDLVSDLQSVTPSAGNNNTGVSYTGHVTTTHFEQVIAQVQGPTSNTVSVHVTAILADNDYVFDNTPSSVEVGESIATITKVYVDPYDGPEISLDISGLAIGGTYNIGSGVTVTKNADGSVTFNGLQEGDQYGIDTSSNFSAIVAEAPTSNTHDLDLGIFTIGSTSAGTAIVQDFNINAIDGDGDAQSGTISTTIDPVTTTLAAKTMMSTSDAVNDNSLTTSSRLAGDMESRMMQSANTNSFAVAAAMVGVSGLAAPAAADSGTHLADDGSAAISVADVQPLVQADLSIEPVTQSLLADDGGQVGDGSNAASSTPSADQPANSGDLAGGNDGGHPADVSPLVAPTMVDPAPSTVEAIVAPMVAMPSAEMIADANAAGNAAKPGLVDKVVVEALANHGGGNVDQLIEAATGNAGHGANPLAQMASNDAGPVHAWDMAQAMGSHAGSDMLLKVDALVLHHDAVQPTVHG